jgi:hypothetical protein
MVQQLQGRGPKEPSSPRCLVLAPAAPSFFFEHSAAFYFIFGYSSGLGSVVWIWACISWSIYGSDRHLGIPT